jgi:hypothetical protein
MFWQGLLLGATHALSCVPTEKFVKVSMTDALPLLLVVLLPELSDPEP